MHDTQCHCSIEKKNKQKNGNHDVTEQYANTQIVNLELRKKNRIKVEKENIFFCTYFLLSFLYLEQI